MGVSSNFTQKRLLKLLDTKKHTQGMHRKNVVVGVILIQVYLKVSVHCAAAAVICREM